MKSWIRLLHELTEKAAGEDSERIKSTDGTVTGNWNFINAIEDSTINIIANWTDGEEEIELLQGQTIRGNFTSIACSSGQVLAS